MLRLTANDTPMLVLNGIIEPAEVYAEDGKLVGVFVPDGIAEKRALYAQPVALTIDEAEIKRRLESKAPGCTLKQIFERFLTMTDDEPTRAHLQKLIREQEDRDLIDQLRNLMQGEPARTELKNLVHQLAENGACLTR